MAGVALAAVPSPLLPVCRSGPRRNPARCGGGCRRPQRAGVRRGPGAGWRCRGGGGTQAVPALQNVHPVPPTPDPAERAVAAAGGRCCATPCPRRAARLPRRPEAAWAALPVAALPCCPGLARGQLDAHFARGAAPCFGMSHGLLDGFGWEP